MNGNYSKLRSATRSVPTMLSVTLSVTLGVVSVMLLPMGAKAQQQTQRSEATNTQQLEAANTQSESEESENRELEKQSEAQPEIEPETLTWARIDFLRNRVQLVPRERRGRRANVDDFLGIGDSLRTARASLAELRFNDGSLARIGERATFRFTPNTRNFQLSNGTVLLLIPPGRGRSTIQTPNAVTGIQGSALFVRYIPETDTTIVGALTDNPNGPMVLFNRDGTEQQALRSNEIGVIQGNQITELYEFDGTLFWQSSGLAEGFNYLDSSSTGSDALDGVRQEIRDAISTQRPISSDSAIVNPDTFVRPALEEPATTSGADASAGSTTIEALPSVFEDLDDTEIQDSDGPALEFQNSPAQSYLQGSVDNADGDALGIGVNNRLEPSAAAAGSEPNTGETSDRSIASGEDDSIVSGESVGEDPTDPTESTALPGMEDEGDGSSMGESVIAGPANPQEALSEESEGESTLEPPSAALTDNSPDNSDTEGSSTENPDIGEADPGNEQGDTPAADTPATDTPAENNNPGEEIINDSNGGDLPLNDQELILEDGDGRDLPPNSEEPILEGGDGRDLPTDPEMPVLESPNDGVTGEDVPVMDVEIDPPSGELGTEGPEIESAAGSEIPPVVETPATIESETIEPPVSIEEQVVPTEIMSTETAPTELDVAPPIEAEVPLIETELVSPTELPLEPALIDAELLIDPELMPLELELFETDPAMPTELELPAELELIDTEPVVPAEVELIETTAEPPVTTGDEPAIAPAAGS